MNVLQKIGLALRETGQALDRLGCVLQGNYSFREQLNRSRSLISLMDKQPSVGSNAFVAPTAVLFGDVRVRLLVQQTYSHLDTYLPRAKCQGPVTDQDDKRSLRLGDQASVFYGSVLRGDKSKIRIGKQTNIQDGCVIRTQAACPEEHSMETEIGAEVTIGHNVSIFGCKIEDESLIGMGAVLQGAKVEKRAMVAAGAVVGPGTVIPAGEIWGGNPARHLRKLKPEEVKFLKASAEHYVKVSAEHIKTNDITLVDVAKSRGLVQ